MATKARWMEVLFIGDLDERITLSTASQTEPIAPFIAIIDPGQTCNIFDLLKGGTSKRFIHDINRIEKGPKEFRTPCPSCQIF